MKQRASRLGGKSGSLVLQRTGTFDGSIAKEGYSVIPGSGTGDLKGLRGEGSSAAVHAKENPMTLDYELG